MPCRDYGMDEYLAQANTDKFTTRITTLKKRTDELSAMLCYLCADDTTNDLIKANPKLNKWWKNHQEQDRLAEERKQLKAKLKLEEEQDDKDRLAILNKLSLKEKKLLNLT